MDSIKLKTLKLGQFFTLKPIEYPNESQVYIREEYDRESKKYFCVKFSDTNHFRMIDGSKDVYIDFIF